MSLLQIGGFRNILYCDKAKKRGLRLSISLFNTALFNVEETKMNQREGLFTSYDGEEI